MAKNGIFQVELTDPRTKRKRLYTVQYVNGKIVSKKLVHKSVEKSVESYTDPKTGKTRSYTMLRQEGKLISYQKNVDKPKKSPKSGIFQEQHPDKSGTLRTYTVTYQNGKVTSKRLTNPRKLLTDRAKEG